MNMAKDPFQQLDVIRRASLEGRKIKDCYRLMYHKSLWEEVSHTLCPSYRKESKVIEQTIAQLKTGRFRFGMGGNTYQEQLVLAVLRMILEAIYVPCLIRTVTQQDERQQMDDALLQIKTTWQMNTWCLSATLPEEFSALNTNYLLEVLSNKIADHRFLCLLHNALKKGVPQSKQQEKKWHETSNSKEFVTLLLEIYFHQLDFFLQEKEYEIASKATDKQLSFIRYKNQLIIGVAGPKAFAATLKNEIEAFFFYSFGMTNEQKNLNFHSLKKETPFLGYTFRKVQMAKKDGKPSVYILLAVPKGELIRFARTHQYGKFETFQSQHRTKIINQTEKVILKTYQQELRSFFKDYHLADNRQELTRLYYLAKKSYIQTLANKRKTTSKKVKKQLRKQEEDLFISLSELKKKTPND